METLGTLKVQQLKDELARRGEDSKGAKVVLVKRLEEVLQREGVDLIAFVTEAGSLEHKLDTYQSDYYRITKKLKKDGDDLLQKIEDGEPSESLQQPVQEWSKHLQELQDKHRQIQSLLDGGERTEQAKDHNRSHADLLQGLTKLELQLERATRQVVPPNAKGGAPSLAGVSSRSGGSSVASKVAMLQLEHKQKQAELMAKQRFLEEKRRLEQRKQELEWEEKQFQLKMEFAINQERMEVLDEFDTEDKGAARSSAGEEEGDTRREVRKEAVHEGEAEAKRRTAKAELGQDTWDKSHKTRQEQKPENQHPDTGSRSRGNSVYQDHWTMKRLKLPTLDLETFRGDTVTFKPFMRAFESNIAANLESEEEKLLYLLKFTRGKAHDIVSTCVHLPEGQGYAEAVRLLTKRFSNHTQVVGRLVDKMMEHPSIKSDDVEGLDNFGIFLRGCLNAVLSMPEGTATVDSKAIRQLVEKLPFYMIDKWRRIADTLEHEQGRMASFRDFVDFVDREARVAGNSTYGRQKMAAGVSSKKDPRARPRIQQVQERTRTLASRVQEEIICAFCHEPTHELDLCKRFGAQREDEKKQYIMKNGLCFSCLKKEGHLARDCKKRKKCQKCDRSHPTSLHRGTTPHPVVKTGHVKQTEHGGGKLQVLPVTARFNGRETCTGAFIDGGSTHSFVSRQLVDALGIVPHQKSTIVISTISGEKPMVTELVTGLCIDSAEGGHTIELPALYVLGEIPVDEEDMVTQEDVDKWSHLRDVVEVPFFGSGSQVGLLVGANALPVIAEPLEVINSPTSGPYAVRSRYGWMVCGIGTARQGSERARINRMKVSTVTEAADHEDFGNSADNRRGLSVEDLQWCLKVEESCTRVDGKYQIALPFREETPDLGNNYHLAERRLSLLKKKLDRNPGYAEDYRTQMKKLLDAGHAEEAPCGQDGSMSGKGHWFLPHHGVVHPSKPGKLRLVYDCAAKYNDLSLNDTLLQGPNLSNLLVDVLLRFRQEPVAFSGDIEAMFLQVIVPETQRNYLKFLWWPDGDTSQPVKQYRVTRHLFGATSSPSCANFALHKTAEDFGDEFDPSVKTTLRRDMYVDDVLKSTSSEDTAVTLAWDLKKLCSKGGFNLTKFSSNSVKVLEAFPQEDRAKNTKDLTLGQDPLPTERVLGVLWDSETDELGFELDIDALKRRPNTRRGILSATAACYDPLGLASAYIIKGRMIMQELTRLKLGWDESIPPEVRADWVGWLAGLPQLMELRIPRCISPGGLQAARRVELHHFSDASERGYGTASYIRTICANGEIHCSLLTSRARVAPIKSISIPRLELTAAKLSVEVNLEVTRAFDVEVDEVVYWSDSTSTLKYINNERTRFNVFVANRLTVIHDGSSKEQWRYVPSALNPADMLSRGSLQDTDVWIGGPAFLQKTPEHWPESPGLGGVSNDDPEVKSCATCLSVDVKAVSTSPIKTLTEYYSTWERLRRGVAWIRRVLLALKDKARGRSTQTSAELSVTDLEEAEECIVRCTQEASFSRELEDLRAGKEVCLSSPLARLDPVLQDGVLRARGRLKHSSLSAAAKYPVILPKKGRTVDLLIQDYHRRAGHEGRQHVLADLRGSYWILGATSAVRRVLSRCLSCLRRQKPPERQKMADLPEDRLQDGEKPFTRTGVDFFGPFYAKRGRSSVKKYGVIFTCLAVRAVHLEVAESLSTDSFLCALRRFVARRGEVRVLRSDRATNFIGADRELRSEVDRLHSEDNRIHRAALSMQIDWKFNPPHASHFGGVWERQIRTVRKILNALLTEQTFSEETLQTLLCEVECIMNNRPLTPVSADVRDEAPITPNHLLHLQSVTLPSSDAPRYGDLVGHRQWKRAAYLAEQFWRRWRKEYLPLLQTRAGPCTRSRTNLKTGDIVLLVDDTVPRGTWPLGRVEETAVGSDGRVRTVRVRARGTTFLRPVTKVVKIVSTDAE